MNFCTFCDNMLFIKNKLNDDNGEVDVTYFCKYCGNSETFNSMTRYDEESLDKSDIPKYLDHDVTLPRRKNVKCTNNAECDKDVILLRNENSSKKYTFYCTGCEKTFTA